MPTHTITRGQPDEGAFQPGDRYDFAEGDVHYTGQIRQVVPLSGANKSEITVEMDTAEYERMLAAQRAKG